MSIITQDLKIAFRNNKKYRELSRLYRNHKYEKTGLGLLFPTPHVLLGSGFTTWQGKGVHMEKARDLCTDANRVVSAGLNDILGVYFSADTQKTAWYLSLYRNNYTPQATDVGSTFPTAGVADEATTQYNEATRPLWVDAGAASLTIGNTASPAVFTSTGTFAFYGAAMFNGSTKGSTANFLAAASLFSSVKNLDNTDVLNVVYTFTIADV